jgi:hypothetical protein
VVGADSAFLRRLLMGGSYAGAASLEELDPELPFDGVDRLRQADMQSMRRGRKPPLRHPLQTRPALAGVKKMELRPVRTRCAESAPRHGALVPRYAVGIVSARRLDGWVIDIVRDAAGLCLLTVNLQV